MRRIRLLANFTTTALAVCVVGLGVNSCTTSVDVDSAEAQSSAGKDPDGQTQEGSLGASTSTPTTEDKNGGATSQQPDQKNDDPSPSETDDSASGKSSKKSPENQPSESTEPEPTESSAEKSPESDDQTDEDQSPPPECKEGEKRSCDELPGGKKVDFPGGEPKGSCKRGTQICQSGSWGSCEGVVAPKAKDTCDPGNDDNCNGKPNDHCGCVAGTVQACGKSIGACEEGTMTCGKDGQWGDCEGDVKPTPEKCDGQNIDEDCNGKADIADPKCQCINGQREACKANGQGDCSLGARTCRNGRWSLCTARFRPGIERCGRQSDGNEAELGRALGDEDCDGKVDESDFRTVEPAGCNWAFVDKDKDRYGAKGPNVATDVKNGTYGCLCPTTQLPRYWKWGERDYADSDCGDCIDGGSEVVPGSSRTDDVPSRCLISLGYPATFDYNCKNGNEPVYVGEFKCSVVPGTTQCQSSGHWLNNDEPECGEEARLHTTTNCEYDKSSGNCSISWELPPLKKQPCG